MPRRRITAETDEKGEVDPTTEGFDELESDDIELEDSKSSEPSPNQIQSKGIAVTYHERSITRTFGKAKLQSGGKKTRYYTPETHGKDYNKLADEFIESMKLDDSEKSERPRYISHKEYD